MASPPHGLAGQSSDGHTIFHPLKFVDVNAYIADNASHVTVTQTFTCLGGNDAWYIFPTPASAAICDFRMQTSGRVIHARVKELEQAQEEFKTAVEEDRWAGLLEEVTEDAFVMSVGAAPRGEDVVITISYVQDLPQDNLVNQLRFTFPTHVAERYGPLPAQLQGPESASTRAQLSIVVDVQSASPIENIYSPTHSIRGLPPDSNRTNVTIELDNTSLVTLERDFVLCIQAADISKPRCIAEADKQRNSVALSLTLVPNLGMNLIPEQEYIFVLDRSGSMSGSRIEFAKAALQVILHSLPSENTSFNIISFGSSYESMWRSSNRYATATLDHATRYVDSISANLGGTEIANAMQFAIRSRDNTKPTSIFVLTDGEIWHVDLFLAQVRSSLAGIHKSVRLFSLGIGDGASTELCEGLARVGNGLCYMTTQGDDIASKCAALLKASRVSPSGTLQNISIDWGILQNATTFAPAPLSSFTITSSPARPYEVILPPPLPLLQAPSTVPSVYPDNRFTISAILNGTQTVPTQVVLRGFTPDGKEIVLPFPVRTYSPASEHGRVTPRPLHILAARRLITELEDGNLTCLGLRASDGDALFRNHVLKASVVRLSVEYQLASRFAAFLATEEEDVGDIEDAEADDDVDSAEAHSDADDGAEAAGDEADDGAVGDAKDGGQDRTSGQGAGRDDENDDSEADDDSVISYKTAESDPQTDNAKGSSSGDRESSSSTSETKDASSSGNRSQQRLDSSRRTPSTSAPPMLFAMANPGVGGMRAAASEAIMIVGNALVQYVPPIHEVIEIFALSSAQARPLPVTQVFHRRSKTETRSMVQQRPAPTPDRVTGIARLQAHDGSFALSPALLTVLSNGVPAVGAQCRTAQPEDIDDTLWGTALVLAFLRTRAATQREVWEALWAKALAFAAARCTGGQAAFVMLVDQAEALFRS